MTGEEYASYYGVVSLEEAKKLKTEEYKGACECYYLDKDLPGLPKGLYVMKMNARRINHNKYDEFIYSAPYRHNVKFELIEFERPSKRKKNNVHN